MGTFLHTATLWKLEGALYTIHSERQFKDSYGNQVSLSLALSLSLSLYGSAVTET